MQFITNSLVSIRQHFVFSFYMQRSQKCKKTVKTSVPFFAFGILYNKAACKLLVKSNPGANFTIILHYIQLLHLRIPKVLNNIDDLTVFFALLGSLHVKAECKM